MCIAKRLCVDNMCKQYFFYHVPPATTCIYNIYVYTG